MSYQNDIDAISGLVEQFGSLEAFEKSHGYGPNAYLIRCQGVRIVEGRLPKDVRSELMRAVKAKKLGHLVKDGLKPEAFFHPNSKWKAAEMRERIENNAIESIRKIMGKS